VDWAALLQEGEAVLPRLGSESDLSEWSEEEGDKSEDGEIKVLMTGPCFGYYNPEFLSRMFLGLPDPDPLVRGTDPDPSIINQK
jgi:hypothetical protein